MHYPNKECNSQGFREHAECNCNANGEKNHPDGEKTLKLALLISVSVLLMEIVGGVISNSLSLLSDAGHVFTDLLSLSLGLFAIRLAKHEHTSSMTYGFHRAEILAALANGTTLIGISLYIFYQAFLRFLHPPHVEAPTLLLFAVLGLIANAGTARLLWSRRTDTLNLRAAFLHVIGDLLGSLGVVVGGSILLFTGITLIDPVVAAIIGSLILKSAIDVSRESAKILLEGVPSEIDLAKVTEEVLKVEGVESVHELHVWSITSGFYVLTGHIRIRDQMLSRAQLIMEKVNRLLRAKFSILHVTLQPETDQGTITIEKHSQNKESP